MGKKETKKELLKMIKELDDSEKKNARTKLKKIDTKTNKKFKLEERFNSVIEGSTSAGFILSLLVIPFTNKIVSVVSEYLGYQIDSLSGIIDILVSDKDIEI